MTCIQIAFLIAYLMMYKPLQSSLYENKEGAIKGTSHLTAKPVHSILKPIFRQAFYGRVGGRQRNRSGVENNSNNLSTLK